MLGLEGDVVDPLPHRSATEVTHRVSMPEPLASANILGVDPKVTDTTLGRHTHSSTCLRCWHSFNLKDVKRMNHPTSPAKHFKKGTDLFGMGQP